GERLLAARQERQGLRLLARWPRQDLEAGLERILVFDQLQLSGAAAEQCGEQALEVAVHHFERHEQPLARLAVEALDAVAQPLDRFDQVVALVDEAGMLRLDLPQLLLAPQLDRA